MYVNIKKRSRMEPQSKLYLLHDQNQGHCFLVDKKLTSRFRVSVIRPASASSWSVRFSKVQFFRRTKDMKQIIDLYTASGYGLTWPHMSKVLQHDESIIFREWVVRSWFLYENRSNQSIQTFFYYCSGGMLCKIPDLIHQWSSYIRFYLLSLPNRRLCSLQLESCN